MPRPRQSNSSEDNSSDMPILKPLTVLFKEVGLAGFLPIILVVIFLWFADAEQKKEFIDTFILMKKQDITQTFPAQFIVIILITTIIIQQTFSKREIRRLKKEIDRLSEERNVLQSHLLGKELKSSK